MQCFVQQTRDSFSLTRPRSYATQYVAKSSIRPITQTGIAGRENRDETGFEAQRESTFQFQMRFNLKFRAAVPTP
ncbi:protein of unknown function [Bradyrhizobium vignae]|uniref:Uncharacterized protein n=1 Tax=Bradyrhizobium vignae TaxID=1549949 RepID=A0A2U3PV99_9BRAD|nr:protein of unknown function [Bradyrhizobium vignae]